MKTHEAEEMLRLAKKHLAVVEGELIENDFCPRCGKPLPDARTEWFVPDNATWFAGQKMCEARACRTEFCEYQKDILEPWFEGLSEEEHLALIYGEATSE